MKPHLVGSVAVALGLLVPSLAGAQQAEKSYTEQQLPAPSRAFEATVGTGYTQGFGMLRSGVGMPSVAHEGIGVEASAGYRIDPHFAISFGGQYQELSAQNASATRGVTGTLAAQYHIVPQTRLDPWVELGTGYRLLWAIPATNIEPTTMVHGWQILRARVGFDVRLSPDVAISPVVGADATTFLWQDVGGTNTAIGSPAVSTFVFAGVQGRLDLGGTKVGTTTVTSSPVDE